MKINKLLENGIVDSEFREVETLMSKFFGIDFDIDDSTIIDSDENFNYDSTAIVRSPSSQSIYDKIKDDANVPITYDNNEKGIVIDIIGNGVVKLFMYAVPTSIDTSKAFNTKTNDKIKEEFNELLTNDPEKYAKYEIPTKEFITGASSGLINIVKGRTYDNKYGVHSIKADGKEDRVFLIPIDLYNIELGRSSEARKYYKVDDSNPIAIVNNPSKD